MYGFSKLMTIAESATGYVGGSYEDYMPTIGLDEATAFLPVVCLECQNEFIDLTRDNNMAMVEAAADAIAYGRTFDADALAEASLEGIKEMISKTFTRIRKFIQSIIAKLRQNIDSMTKSGEALWSKYGNSPALNQDFSGLEMECWSFPGTKILVAADKADVKRLLSSAFGGQLPTPEEFEKNVNGMLSTLRKGGAERKNETLKNMSQAERDQKLVTALTGAKGIGENWREDLTKAVWGEKKITPYGQGNFTKQAIGDVLKNAGGDLKSVETGYVNLEKQIADLEKQVQASAARAAGNLADAKKEGGDTSKLGLISEYYSSYSACVHEAVSVVSYVKQVAVKMHKERANQAKAMLSKILSYNKKAAKAENEDYEGNDDIDVAAFEFDI